MYVDCGKRSETRYEGRGDGRMISVVEGKKIKRVGGGWCGSAGIHTGDGGQRVLLVGDAWGRARPPWIPLCMLLLPRRSTPEHLPNREMRVSSQTDESRTAMRVATCLATSLLLDRPSYY